MCPLLGVDTHSPRELSKNPQKHNPFVAMHSYSEVGQAAWARFNFRANFQHNYYGTRTVVTVYNVLHIII